MPLPLARVVPLVCAVLAAALGAGAWRRAAARSAAEAAALHAGALPHPHVPHHGPSGAALPLILFNDSYFGREFVRHDYAFEARRAEAAEPVRCCGVIAASLRLTRAPRAAGLPRGVPGDVGPLAGGGGCSRRAPAPLTQPLHRYTATPPLCAALPPCARH
jgi:hypothetical protein